MSKGVILIDFDNVFYGRDFETDTTSPLHKFWKEVNEHPKVIL